MTPSESATVGDYAFIGDLATGGLISKDGSIDWLCLPNFDSPACFAGLLGDARHGRWRITPAARRYEVHRRYRQATLILETEFRTADGTVRLVDFMPPRNGDPIVARAIEGVGGRVDLSMDLRPRFGYGLTVPAVERIGDSWRATAGPDTLWLHGPVHVREDGSAAFSVGDGERLSLALMWRPSHRGPPDAPDLAAMLAATERYWLDWVAGLRYTGARSDEVIRSLVTIRALTDRSTGGVLAAPTTSLPGVPGSVRTWDYRCCRLADASATLDILMRCGAREEAAGWRDWLLRATAGPPEQIRGVYGPGGERHRPAVELNWLPGYVGGRPVRQGGPGMDCGWPVAAGELVRASYLGRRAGLPSGPLDGSALLRAFDRRGAEADHGVWDIAGPSQRHVYSRAMAWAGADAMIKMIEWFGLPGDAAAWRRQRAVAHTEILRRGVDRDRGTFVQTFDRRDLDAALLRLPVLNLVAAEDPLVLGTVAAVRADLGEGPLIRRYPVTRASARDELPPGEGAFAACSFWQIEALAIAGRTKEAEDVFASLLAFRTDLGLLAEQYDIRTSQPTGNFPSTAAHVALIGAALRLDNPAARTADSGLERFFPR